MRGEVRREKIIQVLENAIRPIPGTELSEILKVSRQVIVQDIALLRANGWQIFATNRGYLIRVAKEKERVFKVIHGDCDVERELTSIIDLGGKVKDVFIFHKVYGTLRAQLNIRSRRDIASYLADIQSGKSTPLNNVTSGYHYHTVIAETEEILDLIQQELQAKGFLAKLQDYEPVDFWKEKA